MFVLKVLLTLILGLVSLTLTTYFSSDEEKEKVSQPLKIEMTSEQEEIVQKAKDVIKKRTRVKKEKTLAFDLGQKMENTARLIEQPTSQTFSIKEKKSLLEKSSYEIDGYLTSKSSSHLPQGLKKQAKLLSQTIRKNIKKEGFKSSDFSKVFKKGNGRLKARVASKKKKQKSGFFNFGKGSRTQIKNIKDGNYFNPSIGFSDTFTCKSTNPADPDPSDSSLLSEDLYTKQTEEIKRLADQLGTAEKIFNFVKHDIEMETIQGLTQTADLTLKISSGTQADRVSLLIALLRARGIPAVYQAGEVLVEEKTLRNIYGVRGRNDLFWAVSQNYFEQLGFPTSITEDKLIFHRAGKELWIYPNVWARAYVGGTWINLDPTHSGFEMSDGRADINGLTTGVDLNYWFFGSDPDPFIKSGTPLDRLLGQAGNLVRQITGAGGDLGDLGGRRRLDDALPSSSIEGTISAVDPCVDKQVASMEGAGWEVYTDVDVRMGGVTNPSLLIDYSAPIAKVRENLLYLSHSAGLLGEVGNQSGNIELREGDTVKGSFPLQNTTDIEVESTLLPIFGSSVSRKVEVLAGTVNAFGFYITKPGVEELIERSNEVLLNLDGAVSDQKLMAMQLDLGITESKVLMKEMSQRTDLVRNSKPNMLAAIIAESNETVFHFDLISAFAVLPQGATVGTSFHLAGYPRSGNFLSLVEYDQLYQSVVDTVTGLSAISGAVAESVFGQEIGTATRLIQAVAKEPSRTDYMQGVPFAAKGNLDPHNGPLEPLDNAYAEFLADLFNENLVSGYLWTTHNSILSNGANKMGFVVVPSSVNSIIGDGVFLSSVPIAPQATHLNTSQDVELPEDGLANVGGVSGSVRLDSGQISLGASDISLAGRTGATSIGFSRTFVGDLKLQQDEMGTNWVHNWQAQLRNGTKTNGELTLGALLNNNTEDVAFVSSSGQPELFFRQSDGSFLLFGGSQRMKLVQTTTHYELTLKGQIVMKFGLNGKLEQISEPHGEVVNLSYDANSLLESVSTAFAGTISLERDANDRIVKATNERDQQSITYEYDGLGRLIQATDFGGRYMKYSYNGDGRITAVEDTIGRKTTYEYYANGRMFRETYPGGGQKTYQYSPYKSEKWVRIKNQFGQVTEVHYDENFRILKNVAPDGGVTSYEYPDIDSNSGNVFLANSVTDPLGYKTEFEYDELGNLLKIKKPEDSAFTEFTYDSVFNKLIQSKPPIGAYTNYTVDPATGDTLTVSKIGSNKTLSLSMTYDSFGNVLSINNGKSVVSDVRDQNGLVVQKFDPRNPVNISYDSRGRVSSQTTASGQYVAMTYDDFNRPISVVDSEGPDSRTEYDILGRVTKAHSFVESLSEAQTSSQSYDPKGRVASTKNALGQQTSFGYEKDGASRKVLDQPTSVTDSIGRTSVLEYDIMGRVVRQTSHDGKVLRIEYNLRGEQIAIIDPEGNRTRFRYDGNGRVIEVRRPTVITGKSAKPRKLQETTKYTYDELGRVTRVEKALVSSHLKKEWIVTENVYDDFSRVTEKVVKRERSGKVLEVYDHSFFEYADLADANLVTKASNQNVELTYTYENQAPYTLLNYTVKAASGAGLDLVEGTFEIDRSQTGGIAEIRRNGKTILRKSYDNVGRLISAFGKLNGQSLTTTIDRDQFGRKTKVTHSTGLEGNFSYDSFSRLDEVSWTGAETVSSSLSYNDLNQVDQVDREFGSFNYSFSAQDELTSASYTGSESLGSLVNRNFTYDSSGNRVDDTATGEAKYFSNTLIEKDNKKYYSDKKGLGQIVQRDRTDGKDLYDYFPGGLLRNYKKLDVSGTETISAEYFYDPFGRRIAKKKKVSGDTDSNQAFLYLGLSSKILIGKVTKSTSKEVLYIDGQGVDEHLGEVGQTPKGYVTDHLGSVLNSLASGGKLTYGPFGENLGSVPGENLDDQPVIYGYTGRQLDAESGLYYYRARYYDPDTGRFMTKDPLGIQAGINLYRYSGNDPVNNVDPSGLFFGSVVNTVISAVGADRATGGALSGAAAAAAQAAERALNDAREQLGKVGRAAAVAATAVVNPSFFSTAGSLFGDGQFREYSQDLLVGQLAGAAVATGGGATAGYGLLTDGAIVSSVASTAGGSAIASAGMAAFQEGNFFENFSNNFHTNFRLSAAFLGSSALFSSGGLVGAGGNGVQGYVRSLNSVREGFDSGLTIGSAAFLDTAASSTAAHEFGHTIQFIGISTWTGLAGGNLNDVWRTYLIGGVMGTTRTPGGILFEEMSTFLGTIF